MPSRGLTSVRKGLACLLGLLLVAWILPARGDVGASAGSAQEEGLGGFLGSQGKGEEAGQQPIDYTGDRISFDQNRNVLEGEGNVLITYKDMALRANRVVAYLDTSDVYADGKVILTVGSQVFTGERVHFNFKTRLGDFVHGTGYVDPWYAFGENIRKAGPNEYQITEGYVTSCDYADPHYKIKAKKIYVFPRERLIAKDVFFNLLGLDILWFPVFSRSLKDERERFTFIPGYNRRFGAFALMGYNFWIDPYLTGTVHADLYAKRGVGTGVDFDYNISDHEVLPAMSGSFQSYVIDDQNFAPTQDEGVDPGSTRYRIDWEHSQQLYPDTQLLAEVHALSDPSIVDDFFREEFEEDVQPETFLSITKNTEDYRLSLFFRKRINDIFTELERLPELQFQTRTLPLGDSGLYYTTENSMGYYHQVPIDANDYDSFRADTLHELSYPFKALRFLNLEPSMSLRETFYSSGVRNDNLLRTIFTFEIDAFAKLHKRNEEARSEFWDVHQLRHVIEPRITYTFTPKPTKRPEELLQFDGIDSRDHQNSFRFGIRQLLQTRRRGQTENIIDADLFVRYFPNSNILTEDRFGKSHHFSDISLDAEFRPLEWFAFDLRVSYNPFNTEITQLIFDLGLIHGDKWNLSLRQRQVRGQNNLSAVEFLYRFSEDWVGKAFWRYDFEFGTLEAQEYTILRDLHCWEAALTFRQRRLRDDLSLFLVLRLKDYPAVPIRFGN